VHFCSPRRLLTPLQLSQWLQWSVLLPSSPFLFLVFPDPRCALIGALSLEWGQVIFNSDFSVYHEVPSYLATPTFSFLSSPFSCVPLNPCRIHSDALCVRTPHGLRHRDRMYGWLFFFSRSPPPSHKVHYRFKGNELRPFRKMKVDARYRLFFQIVLGPTS